MGTGDYHNFAPVSVQEFQREEHQSNPNFGRASFEQGRQQPYQQQMNLNLPQRSGNGGKSGIQQNHCSCQDPGRPCNYCFDQAVRTLSKTSASNGSLMSRIMSSKARNEDRQRKKRCKKCKKCLSPDCGECKFCLDMIKYGGPGVLKQSCRRRACIFPIAPGGSSRPTDERSIPQYNLMGSNGNSPASYGEHLDNTATLQRSMSMPSGNQTHDYYRENAYAQEGSERSRSNYSEFPKHKQFHGDRRREFEKKDRVKKFPHRSSLWKASKRMYDSNFRAYN